jgi:hypothetical protein
MSAMESLDCSKVAAGYRFHRSTGSGLIARNGPPLLDFHQHLTKITQPPEQSCDTIAAK